jgi:hypothetical protein
MMEVDDMALDKAWQLVDGDDMSPCRVGLGRQ